MTDEKTVRTVQSITERPITPPFLRRRCKQLFLVIFLLRPMATELDVSKSRRFDIAMSRRTRRSTYLVACFQDQYVPQHGHQDAKLKTLLQCQDAERQGFHQFEEAEQQNPGLHEESEELRIPQAPLQYEDGEEKTLEQYEDQQKEPWRYQDREQKKQEQHQDGEKKKPEQDLDDEKTPQRFEYEDAKISKYQDEKLVSLKEYEFYCEQYQDDEHKAPQQCQEADEPASEQHEEESEDQKAPQESRGMDQKTSEQRQGAKNLPTPPGAVDGVPRFSLQELIQQKQLPVKEAKITSKLGGHDHKVSGSVGAATGGTTLAMVIRRPEGGKKSMGVIRRCVKAFNQMIKAKHGSKKSTTL